MTDKAIIRIGGMSCVRCSTAVENALTAIDGVVSVSVSYASGRAEVEYDSATVGLKKLYKAIKSAGYEVIYDQNEFRHREAKRMLGLFVVSAFFSLPFFFMMLMMTAFPDSQITHLMHNAGWVQFFLSLPVQFVIGSRFYIGAFKSLRNKSPGMDLLVAVGTTSAWGYSLYNLISGSGELYFESSVVIITLILLGKLLEARAKNRSSAAVASLMALTPGTASVIRDGQSIELSAADILCGDTVVLKPGSSVPADGTVISGSSTVNESMLTGESMPIQKSIGDKLYGGTVNGNGTLLFTAESVGNDTVLSEIIRMVENAQSSKAHIQRLADKVAAVFVPTVIAVALLTFVLNLVFSNASHAVASAVSVLVIACPCSLGLATPTALMVGIGRGASLGILIKDANALESACNIKALIIDKTGTVTEGRPTVTLFSAIEMKSEEALRLAAAVENGSSHPIAAAILDYYGCNDIPEATDIETFPGKGVSATVDGHRVKLGAPDWFEIKAPIHEAVEAEGKTVVQMSVDGRPAALIAVSDPVRSSSRDTVCELKKLGIRTIMVTGDNASAAASVAKAVGVDETIDRALPEDKVNAVKAAKAKYGLTAVVGDGINDAPALAASDIGFAVIGGTDIAMETGDVVLLGQGIEKLSTAIRLSKATMRKIKQNLFWAFFYNSIGIPLAAFGLLSPALAGAAMAFSSVSVVTNSLLLKKTKLF